MSDPVQNRGPRSPELRDYADDLERQIEEVEALVGPLSDGAVAWRPDGKRWSIGQCLVHLALTNGRYITEIETAVERGRDQGLTGDGPFRHGWLGNLLVRMIRPPVRLRVKAMKELAPPPVRTKAEAVDAFMAEQRRLERAIVHADGLDLGRVKLASPATRRLKLTLGQAFEFVLGHNDRHIVQARGVAADPAFPGR
ncbi:MAG: DinB family protein [Gemmatimonadota bacterium]